MKLIINIPKTETELIEQVEASFPQSEVFETTSCGAETIIQIVIGVTNLVITSIPILLVLLKREKVEMSVQENIKGKIITIKVSGRSVEDCQSKIEKLVIKKRNERNTK